MREIAKEELHQVAGGLTYLDWGWGADGGGGWGGDWGGDWTVEPDLSGLMLAEVGATGDNGTGYTGSYSNPTGTSLDGYDINMMNRTPEEVAADKACLNGIFGGMIAGSSSLVGAALGLVGGALAGGCFN